MTIMPSGRRSQKTERQKTTECGKWIELNNSTHELEPVANNNEKMLSSNLPSGLVYIHMDTEL